MNLKKVLKQFPRLVARTIIWGSTATVLLLCILFARLFFAPINLDFARDIVTERAAEFLPGWQVSFSEAEVGWDWSAVRPWMELRNLSLIDRRNRLNARIPEARIHISFGSLFSGVSLSSVDVRNAHVNLTDIGGFSDDTDESMFDDLFARGIPTPEVFKPVTEAFSRFAVRLMDNAPALEDITFLNFSVDIARGEALSVYSLAAPTFRLERYDDQLQVAAQLDANMAEVPMRVRLAGTAKPAAGTLGVSLIFSDLSPSDLADAVDLRDSIEFMHFPFGLDLQLEMTSEEGLRFAAFEVSIGEGELQDSVKFPGGSPVKYGVVAAAYDVERRILTFEEIELALGDALAKGDGLIYWEDGAKSPGLRFNLGLANAASIEQILQYWPVKVEPDGSRRGAREWVRENMQRGTVRNVKFELNVDHNGQTPYKNQSPFKVTFDLDDVDTKFVTDMAPIQGASGSAVYTHTEFDVTLAEGNVNGLSIGGSTAHMYNIHNRGEGIGEYNVKLSGPVRDILRIVEPAPVNIQNLIKVDLDRLGGEADVTANLRIPLIKKPPKELVAYDITADVTDGSLRELLGGEGLRHADIKISVDNNDLTAAGHGAVNGVAMDLYWRENFFAGREDPGADTSLLVMSGTVDQVGLQALGVDVDDYVEGQMLAEATFLGRNLKFRAGYFSADASEAQLMVPQLAWRKESVVPANVNGTVYFDENRIRIDPLTVTGEGIDVEGHIKWGSGGRADFEANFAINTLGRSKMQAAITSKPGAPVAATIKAHRFDLAPLLVRDNKQATASQPAEAGQPFALSVDADEMLLLNGTVLSDAKIDIAFNGEEPVDLLATGVIQQGTTTVKIGRDSGQEAPGTNGEIVADSDTMQTISVTSSDGGALIRGLGLFAHLEGGALSLEGETSGWGDSLQLLGTLEVRDTQLVAKSKLGVEVTEGVVSGLDSYLEDGSITLDILDMPFSFQEGLLDLSGVKANGPRLGMTMEGQIETNEGKINVNGVVVPAYGLNSLLGKIPIVGGLFSGGKGKGLFGVAYRVKGLTEEPDVSVNTLSGLAPGFLRLLFEGRKGKVSDVENRPAPEEPPENNDQADTEVRPNPEPQTEAGQPVPIH